MLRRYRLGLVFAVLMPTAADASPDSQIWTTAAASLRLSDNWRLSEEIVTRFSDNRDGLYEVEAVTMVNYRPVKNVTVAAGYVHNPQYAGGDFTVMEHRAREQVTIDNVAQIGPGKLSLRARLEQRWRSHLPGTGWRLRPYAKFSLPLAGKASVNLSHELFVDLNTTSFQRKEGIDRMRNLITVSAPIASKINAEAGYMNQHGFVRDGADTSDNIAYFGLSASF